MTPEQAVDAILDIFKAAWDLTGHIAIYDDKPGEIPPSETPWARVTIKHATGGQSSLSGASGTKRFTERGNLFVQIFTPVGDGSTACYQLAKLVRDAYRDARDPDVWFRNVFLEEIGISGAFRQTNVRATFTYDEVR